MYYYAQLNNLTNVVLAVHAIDTQYQGTYYIEVDETFYNNREQYINKYKYDFETEEFVLAGPQDLKAHKTSEIAYKSENKWLDTKLDEMETAIANAGSGSSIFNVGTGTDSYAMKITDSTCVNTAEGDFALAMGVCNTAYAFNTVIGKFSKEDNTRGYQSNVSGDSFIIGNGTKSISSGTVVKNNGFRVTYEGAVYGAGAYNSSGADYSECFEWLDGNPNNEDRVGQFVTLDGDKIRIANASDYVLGVVTACSSVIGNNPIDWSGRFQKDVFGRILKDSEGIPLTVSDYDETQPYIERVKRKEWATVGLLGQLVVEDDGTCLVNGYCNVLGGIATGTNSTYNSYRVMKRLDENHILILFR